MLVLGRKPGQSVMIGPDIRVTVTKCTRGYVHLGFDAPSEIKVLRSELIKEQTNDGESEG